MKPIPTEATALASARFPFTADFLGLAVEFVEQAARGFGFGAKECGSLVLAVEEVFSFYLVQAAPASTVDVAVENRGWQLAVDLTLRLANPDLRAFNLTYRADPDDEASLLGLGPMIAARSVTRLRLDFGSGERLVLRLFREREYAPAAAVALPAHAGGGGARVVEPSQDDLRYFAALAAGAGDGFLPGFLARPGMAADMLAAGDLGALLAQEGDALLGGVLWRRLGEATAEIYGPYLFYPDPDDSLLTLLFDEAFGRLSRSGARLAVRRQGPIAGHERFFDFLGELSLAVPGAAAPLAWPHYYRQLREESGGVVYADPRFAQFLRGEYARLCLPRQVRELPAAAESRRQASLLAVEFEPGRSLAVLRPLSAGQDMAENLAAHLQLIEREGIRNAVVEIDAGRGDETAFAPILFDAGFLPRLLIPDAGQGDLVLFAR